jgi:hypothetical protein
MKPTGRLQFGMDQRQRLQPTPGHHSAPSTAPGTTLHTWPSSARAITSVRMELVSIAGVTVGAQPLQRRRPRWCGCAFPGVSRHSGSLAAASAQRHWCRPGAAPRPRGRGFEAHADAPASSARRTAAPRLSLRAARAHAVGVAQAQVQAQFIQARLNLGRAHGAHRGHDAGCSACSCAAKRAATGTAVGTTPITSRPAAARHGCPGPAAAPRARAASRGRTAARARLRA